MKDNNGFFRVNKIEGKAFLSFDLDTMTKYDQIACGALKLETPEFIMPVIFERGTGMLTVRYSVPDGCEALDVFNKTLVIEDVLKLYEYVLSSLEECRDWYLVPEGFCFDTNHVYIRANHEQLVFAYIPDGRTTLDVHGLKSIFISLLEKCTETSGGTIQLQLYKYFYKPKFSIEEFKEMVEKFKDEISYKQQVAIPVEVKRVSEPVVPTPPIEKAVIPTPPVEKTVPEIPQKKIEVPVKKEEATTTYGAKTQGTRTVENNPRSVYAAQPNRSQLSQEEIEEMVKSIYSSKPVETVEKKVAEEPSIYGAKDTSTSQASNQEEREEDKEESFYGSKSKSTVVNTASKTKNLFDNVFSTSSKNNKAPTSAGERRRGPVLKSISTHTRYDLPKVVPIDFKGDKFIIGRATRTGEETGANYEFGAEITPISRVHAQIERQDELYYLKDLGSSNGTFLNGTKIEPDKAYQIEEGDKIAFAIAFSKNSIEYMFVE